MFELDGTQNSWLVYADFLEDNGLPNEGIRDFEVKSNEWHYGYVMSINHVGNEATYKVGTRNNDNKPGGFTCHEGVGGMGIAVVGVCLFGRGGVGGICSNLAEPRRID